MEAIAGPRVRKSARPLTVCHFTTAHTELKSRSFHRQMMPLAACNTRIRYAAPIKSSAHLKGVDLVALPRQKSRLRRLLATPVLLRTLLRQKADLYHFQDTELLPLAFTLKLVFRKRVIYDAYEDFPAMAAASESLPRLIRPIAAAIVSAAERFAARAFDGLMTADPLTLRRLANVGNSKKLVFYNFPNLDMFPAPPARSKEFDVVYRGGLSERTGTYVLLDAVKLLIDQGREIRLLLIGYFDDAAAERALRLRVHALRLDASVVIRGRVDHEEMAAALSEARIGVCPLQPVPKFVRNIPVKVFEYWACGMPVVASDLPPIRPFFRHAQTGLVYSPADADRLSQAIAWLLDHPQAAARMGRRGRALVEQRLNNRGEIQKLRRFCAQIAGRGSFSVEWASEEASAHA